MLLVEELNERVAAVHGDRLYLAEFAEQFEHVLLANLTGVQVADEQPGELIVRQFRVGQVAEQNLFGFHFGLMKYSGRSQKDH